MNSEELDRLHLLLDHPVSAESLEPSLRTRLLLKGAIFSLQQEGSTEAVETLFKVVLSNQAEFVRDDARSALIYLAREGLHPAREALCELFLVLDDPIAGQIAINAGYVPGQEALCAGFYLLTGQVDLYDALDPDQDLLTHFFRNSPPAIQQRLLVRAQSADLGDWALTVRAETTQQFAVIHRLADELPDFRSQHQREVGLRTLAELARSGNSTACEAIFDLFLLHDYAPAGDLAQGEFLLPEEAGRRALFFFLTGQWQRYEDLDFNHTLLAGMYDIAGRRLRSRIVEQTRLAGRTDWIQGIAPGRRVRWLADMTDTDWEAVTRQLTGENRWDDLWTLAQVGPPIWDARILSTLQSSGWQPDSSDTQAGFFQLVEKAANCIGVEPPLQSISLVPNLPTGSMCLAAASDGETLALAGNENLVYLLKVGKEQPIGVLPSSPAQVWCLAFSSETDMIATGSGDGRIRIWRLRDEQLMKTLENHVGLVRAMQIAQDGHVLISASFDRTLRIWRFPYGPEQKIFNVGNAEVLSMAASSDGSTLAAGLGDGSIQMWDIPSGTQLTGSSGHSEAVSALAISPDGRILVSGSRDQTIILWTYPEGRLITRLQEHNAQVSTLAFHPEALLLASGDLEGTVCLWSFPEGKLVQRSKQEGPITGMAFVQQGESLVTCSRDGPALLWDLRWLIFTRLAIEQAGLIEESRIEAALAKEFTTASVKAWLEFSLSLIRWRRRFDISVEEPQRVITGEFDIEL
ncbi:MAG: WD40 repeat domain-containing protein [Anaerolineaceae bacterium]|nr:WD40 repeat domain-containing protein [Anaerolineaceae bacterium]